MNITNVYACIDWEVADIRNAMECDSFEPTWCDEEIERWLKDNQDKLYDVMLQAGWHYIYEEITALKESAKCYKK